MSEPRITSFEEFWPFYVKEHLNPLNRTLHFIGSSSALACVLGAVAAGQWWMLPAAPLVGYGFAWFGHFVIEKNKPASFKYPLWSFKADWIMWFKILTGQMNAEVRRIVGDEPEATDTHPSLN